MDPTMEIPKENRGYQMLLKMGFRDGTGLGKHGDGILSPVCVHFKNDRRGLGMELGQENNKETSEIQFENSNLDTAKTSANNCLKMQTEYLHQHWNSDDDWDTDEDQDKTKGRNTELDSDKTQDCDEENDIENDCMENSSKQSNKDYEMLEDWDKDEEEENWDQEHDIQNDLRGLDVPGQFMKRVPENNRNINNQCKDGSDCSGEDWDAEEYMYKENDRRGEEGNWYQECDTKNESRDLAAPGQFMKVSKEHNGEILMDHGQTKNVNIANQSPFNCNKMETEHAQEFWDTDQESDYDFFRDMDNNSDEENKLNIGDSIFYF